MNLTPYLFALKMDRQLKGGMRLSGRSAQNEPRALSICIEDGQTIKRRNATFWTLSMKWNAPTLTILFLSWSNNAHQHFHWKMNTKIKIWHICICISLHTLLLMTPLTHLLEMTNHQCPLEKGWPMMIPEMRQVTVICQEISLGLAPHTLRDTIWQSWWQMHFTVM